MEPSSPCDDGASRDLVLKRLSLALEIDGALVREHDYLTGCTFITGGEGPLRVLAGSIADDLDAVHPEDRQRVQSVLAAAAASGERFRTEYRVDPAVAAAGHAGIEPVLWVALVGEFVRGPDGRTERLITVAKDVTELHVRRDQTEQLAFRDSLTGLPNRALFQREFERASEAAELHGETLGLVMVDVDHFKDVNDTLGHDAGDALLCALAGKMTQAFRRDDIVCRLGGDEFAIILTGLHNHDDLVRPVELLQNMLMEPIRHRNQGFTISASIGVALHDDPDADASHLIKNADIALYRAKEAGRNRAVVFEPYMRSEVEKRLELLRDVRAAIPLGEFSLLYQPVISLDAGAVVGLEALTRWNHPDHGVLGPAAFMDAFDDQDLSLQLGKVTIESALGQMRAWLDEGLEFGRVAINISSGQFRTGRLAEEIAAQLLKWNVPAERLAIEVTENVYMGWGAEMVGETVRTLHASGVTIALDDFGTGYASLANLRQFPIDRLKIDKSFVQNVDDEAIVRAVINLGASLGMEVVAEGVEKPEQLDTLSKYGCDKIQGYHFARPMPPADVPGFIAKFARSTIQNAFIDAA